MINPYSRECPSIYRGVVESNVDPENLGRCKIRVPSIHGELTYPIDIIPWARPIVLSPISSGKGTVNIPDIGDIVWVLFEGANRDFPIYLGGTYATEELDIDLDRVDFYIEDDTVISYHRKDKKYSISLGNNMLSISKEGIVIKGNLSIDGNLVIKGSCNKECDCP